MINSVKNWHYNQATLIYNVVRNTAVDKMQLSRYDLDQTPVVHIIVARLILTKNSGIPGLDGCCFGTSLHTLPYWNRPGGGPGPAPSRRIIRGWEADTPPFPPIMCHWGRCSSALKLFNPLTLVPHPSLFPYHLLLPMSIHSIHLAPLMA